MKKLFSLSFITLLIALIFSLLIGLPLSCTKSDFFESLSNARNTEITFYDENPVENSEAKSATIQYEIDSIININSSYPKDLKSGCIPTEWKYVDINNKNASLPKNITVVDGKIEDIYITQCALCFYAESWHEHTFATEWTSDKNYHWHEASCGMEEHNEDKAFHTWDSGTVTTAATCTTAGVKTFACIVCRKTKTEEIPAGHTWNEVITTPPTTSTDGIKTFTCTVCSATKTQTIQKLGNKVINGVECQKTEEVNICTESTTVKMTDNSNWSGYVAERAPANYKGVYISGRNVTLSPFAMGKYEVTQELFEAVMGTNPSCYPSDTATGETQKLRPVEKVNWYHAIAFCNKLSILEGLEPCYTVNGINDWVNRAYKSIPTSSRNSNISAWNAATCDLKKNGYRLPTEAEWEFAARGGNANVDEWKYAFSGVNVTEENMVYVRNELKTDENLDAYAWYSNNSGTGNKTHEVGLKLPNSLGLYDMSGNVFEWCWDRYDRTVSAETVTDPTGPASGSLRLLRGGSWNNNAYYCAVSFRYNFYPYYRNYTIGFRLARSL